MSHPARILLLGAGFVAKPALRLLHDHGFKITVGCVDLNDARSLCRDLKNAEAKYLDVLDTSVLDEEVAKVDLVISLIPYFFHVPVIESAIRNAKNVVTTSYISPSMASLHQAAKEAGITVLNECGLDPGIDHLLAIRAIGKVHALGGYFRSFSSFCGALPAPECADNPLGYKFSWSPRGVLLALKNDASFYRNGVVRHVSGENLMDEIEHIQEPGLPLLVAYPNRDSLAYRERYLIPEAQNVIRSTLRYAQFPSMFKCLREIGLLSEERLEWLDPSREPLPWKAIMQRITDAATADELDLSSAIKSRTSFLSTAVKNKVIDGIRWLGLLSDEPAKLCQTPLDTLCAKLEAKLKYAKGERDMVVLEHRFEIEHRNGDIEKQRISITDFGDPDGDSALSRLVGITCAVAAEKLLSGEISDPGVIAPLKMNTAGIILAELEKYGIKPRVESDITPAERATGRTIIKAKEIEVT